MRQCAPVPRPRRRSSTDGIRVDGPPIWIPAARNGLASDAKQAERTRSRCASNQHTVTKDVRVSSVVAGSRRCGAGDSSINCCTRRKIPSRHVPIEAVEVGYASREFGPADGRSTGQSRSASHDALRVRAEGPCRRQFLSRFVVAAVRRADLQSASMPDLKVRLRTAIHGTKPVRATYRPTYCPRI